MSRPDLEFERKKHLRYQQMYHPPKRQSVSSVDNSGQSLIDFPARIKDIQRKEIDAYTWEDRGDDVVIKVESASPENIDSDGIRLSIEHGDAVSVSFLEILSDRTERIRCLVLHPLFAKVVSDSSSVRVDKFNKIILRLSKFDKELPWTSLVRRETTSGIGRKLDSTEISKDKPISDVSVGGDEKNMVLYHNEKVRQHEPSSDDLAKLRRALIQQRKNKKPGDGLLVPREFTFQR